PFLFVVANEALGALLECLCASSCDDGGTALRMLVGDRINAIEPELACRARTLTSFRQCEQPNWTEAHVAVVAVGGVSINPLFRAALGDAKVEAATVGIHARLLRALDLEARQSVKCSNHLHGLPAIRPAHSRTTDTDRRRQTRQDGGRTTCTDTTGISTMLAYVAGRPRFRQAGLERLPRLFGEADKGLGRRH